MIQAKVIADSINEQGDRLTTLQIRVHRYVWAEFLTHRAFSRNASSSRAIPVSKMLSQVWNDPAMPVIWASNKPGMQAGAELPEFRKTICRALWKTAGKTACMFAWSLMQMGLHKQWANRLLEPWQWINAVVSATDWDNFFSLRIHLDAQPEIKVLAECMKSAINRSSPIFLRFGEWHLPYVQVHDGRFLYAETRSDELLSYLSNGNEELIKASAARCARVSYLKHDGKEPFFDDDLALCNKLTKSRPIHASPFEHQATPVPGKHGNFIGWKQYRQFIEEEL